MKTEASAEHAHLKPATSPLDGPMQCACGWTGLRSQATRAALQNAGKANEYYVACCPQCQEFRLRPVVAK